MKLLPGCGALFSAAMIFILDLSIAADAASLNRQRHMGIQVGNASSLTICSGYSCARKPRLLLTSKQLRYIDRSMKSAKSASREREAIANLLAWKERVAQRRLGMPRDKAKATGFDLGPGQMDCIDESTNTIGFLQLLNARGLLKHHVVAGYRDRGFVIDGRLPHTTAVVNDKAGKAWAIDSWYRAGGEPPVIVPLKQWLKEDQNSY